MTTSTVRVAQSNDIGRLMSFLQEASLSTEGVAEAIDYFILMEDDQGELKAGVGIEPYDDCGLLRSLVMRAGTSEHDLLYLLQQIFALAKDKGLTSVFLASNKRSTLELFLLMGFKKAEKADLPTSLLQSSHVQHVLTVDNSFFLQFSI
ncbi:GNAT family N-acetyltransferase [Cytobacillus purgationiresistens]|uniref:N-acetylglutamate synthase-like GNAT family acetyltransferase n=1 Tax=Cytobacillus purgationiresistens TaxID=863449 RepID=A0ABU0AEQ3_9BACI|nr:hypothetical protein [Cytobacillus purgationiresistens]MDQ0269272.1 N-acetylglutamate synthase-like GNAT family acetyltransferase [Cytobacillus purgationiresistens]